MKEKYPTTTMTSQLLEPNCHSILRPSLVHFSSYWIGLWWRSCRCWFH